MPPGDGGGGFSEGEPGAGAQYRGIYAAPGKIPCSKRLVSSTYGKAGLWYLWAGIGSLVGPIDS